MVCVLNMPISQELRGGGGGGAICIVIFPEQISCEDSLNQPTINRLYLQSSVPSHTIATTVLCRGLQDHYCNYRTHYMYRRTRQWHGLASLIKCDHASVFPGVLVAISRISSFRLHFSRSLCVAGSNGTGLGCSGHEYHTSGPHNSTAISPLHRQPYSLPHLSHSLLQHLAVSSSLNSASMQHPVQDPADSQCAGI